jgi:hypothetical protein
MISKFFKTSGIGKYIFSMMNEIVYNFNAVLII